MLAWCWSLEVLQTPPVTFGALRKALDRKRRAGLDTGAFLRGGKHDAQLQPARALYKSADGRSLRHDAEFVRIDVLDASEKRRRESLSTSTPGPRKKRRSNNNTAQPCLDLVTEDLHEADEDVFSSSADPRSAPTGKK